MISYNFTIPEHWQSKSLGTYTYVSPVSPVSPIRLAHLWVDFRVILLRKEIWIWFWILWLNIRERAIEVANVRISPRSHVEIDNSFNFGSKSQIKAKSQGLVSPPYYCWSNSIMLTWPVIAKCSRPCNVWKHHLWTGSAVKDHLLKCWKK